VKGGTPCTRIHSKAVLWQPIILYISGQSWVCHPRGLYAQRASTGANIAIQAMIAQIGYSWWFPVCSCAFRVYWCSSRSSSNSSPKS